MSNYEAAGEDGRSLPKNELRKPTQAAVFGVMHRKRKVLRDPLTGQFLDSSLPCTGPPRRK
jgi:hypothetical protein